MTVNKDLLYSCKRCQSAKPTKVVIVFPRIKEGDDKTKEEREIFKPYSRTITIDGKEYKQDGFLRLLDCNHYVPNDTPGFKNPQSENDSLDSDETLEIRRKLEMKIVGLQAKELEQVLLFHVEQYQTLLKLATKQMKQAKYAMLFIDQLKEKYTSQLSDEKTKLDFEQKFRHFSREDYAHGMVIERERTKVEKEADKQKLAVEAMKKALLKSGYDPKDLFSK